MLSIKLTSMDLQKILRNSGLNSKEAKVYLTLLELDEAPASVIARVSNLKRPTAYVILNSLIKKALVSTFTHNKITYYKAVNPKRLFSSQKEKLLDLQKALPDLQSIHEKYLVKPEMTIYEGYNGLIQIMEDTLTVQSNPILAWADVETTMKTVIADYMPKYIEKKVRKKVHVRGIVSDNSLGHVFQEKGRTELRELKFVDPELFPFKNEINIYDDKVAIISHVDQIGVIIQNQAIADTQKSIFRLCYSLLD